MGQQYRLQNKAYVLLGIGTMMSWLLQTTIRMKETLPVVYGSIINVVRDVV